MTQDTLLPGDAHWIIRVVHLVFGLVAISLVEVLVRRALERLSVNQRPRSALGQVA